jgi:hypothetical protein
MKTIAYIIQFHFLFLMISCNGQVNNTEDTTAKIKNENKKNDDDQKLKDLIKNNKIGIITLARNNDTLEIISDQKLTWKPLGELSVLNLQEANNNIFRVNENTEIDSTYNQKVKSYTLNYKNSFIRMIRRDGNNELMSARIKDSEINLVYGIKVGISKQEFLKIIFVDPDFEVLKGINVIQNFDPPGETIDETFIFKENILSEIIMRIPGGNGNGSD